MSHRVNEATWEIKKTLKRIEDFYNWKTMSVWVYLKWPYDFYGDDLHEMSYPGGGGVWSRSELFAHAISQTFVFMKF